jgi:hypothetical protein
MNKDQVVFGKKISSQILIAVALGILTIVLILGIILPQVQGITVEIEKNSNKTNEVRELQASLSALNAVSPERLKSDVEVLTTALPTNKEVISVFSSIISLATQAGVQVRGFTIQVGEVYDTKEGEDTEDLSSKTSFPSMNVILSLTSSNQRQVITFTEELYKSFPIAKINSVASQEGSSSLEISFYYRPYDLERLQNTKEVPAYTNETLQLLEQLRAEN